MLLQLTIKNFALIEEIRLDFDKGLNVLTGETGAGKSILIDALKGILGERVSSSVLRDKEKPCVVEGVFTIPESLSKTAGEWSEFLAKDDEYVILRREIAPDGKSRNYLNRQLVNLSTLKELGRRLIDFHGQYDQQTIFETETHLVLTDRLAGLHASGGRSGLLSTYHDLYTHYAAVSKKKKSLLEASENKQRQVDLLKYQIDEIEKVEPEEGEDGTLETERIRLSHAQKLQDLTQGILKHLDEEEGSASARVSDSRRPFQQWLKIDSSAGKFNGELEEIQLRLEELIRSVKEYQASLVFDEGKLEELQERLDSIYALKRKYGGSVSAVIRFLAESKQQYDELINSDLYQLDLEKEMARLLPDLTKAALAVTKQRREAAKKLKEAVEQELKTLGIPQGVFEARVIETELGANGAERVEFFLNPNPGQELRPLVKVASGGEASRILLALKRALARVDETPTLIFDEIDANIGGRLGEVVGRKLREISGERQILLITHLPQIASFAEKHYKVTKTVKKGVTHVHYALLEGEERVRELAQMMSGLRETEISRTHAEEMLRTASR